MTLTFDPGTTPEMPFTRPLQWPVDEQGFIKPYYQALPKALNPVQAPVSTIWVLTQDQWEYVESFFREIGGPAGDFFWTPPRPISGPMHRGPDLSEVTVGGAPGSTRTYWARYTWFHPTLGVETKPSPASSLEVQAGNVLRVTVPIFPIRVPAFRIYVGTVEGSEWAQGYSTVRTWDEPTTGIVEPTTAPPSANNFKVPQHWGLVGGIEPPLVTSNRYRVELRFRELHV